MSIHTNIFHFQEHFDKHEFCCDKCGQKFKSQRKLYLHIKLHHTRKIQVAVYPCETCQQTFQSRYDLSVHRTHTHTDKELHYCNVCTKGFVSDVTLQRHMLIHSGEKPYSCDICGRGFNQKYSVKLHRYTHTGDKPHKCTHCDYSTIKPLRLKEHILSLHAENA